jgi:DNA-binding transcriptional ArsR family regulator
LLFVCWLITGSISGRSSPIGLMKMVGWCRKDILAAFGAETALLGIVEELGISQPLASHHLKELKRALLVSVERSGPFIYYELADPRIAAILTELKSLATDLLANRTAF